MMKQFLSDESGQTMVEYGLLVSLIALIVVAAVTILGRGVRDNLYGKANNELPF